MDEENQFEERELEDSMMKELEEDSEKDLLEQDQ